VPFIKKLGCFKLLLFLHYKAGFIAKKNVLDVLITVNKFLSKIGTSDKLKSLSTTKISSLILKASGLSVLVRRIVRCMCTNVAPS
jgi:hypothetical protein